MSYGDGRTSCKCVEKCPRLQEPVCGTDKRDYSSVCEMKARACAEKRDVQIMNYGACGGKILIQVRPAQKANSLSFLFTIGDEL